MKKGKITLQELNPHGYEDLTPRQQANQARLCEALNKVRDSYGRPMIITSGVRSWEDHAAIYRRKRMKPPRRSKHLKEIMGAAGALEEGPACAADVADRDGSLANWCLDNLHKLQEWGLYCESFEMTQGWCHFQTEGPKSGRTIFIP